MYPLVTFLIDRTALLIVVEGRGVCWRTDDCGGREAVVRSGWRAVELDGIAYGLAMVRDLLGILLGIAG